MNQVVQLWASELRTEEMKWTRRKFGMTLWFAGGLGNENWT